MNVVEVVVLKKPAWASLKKLFISYHPHCKKKSDLGNW